MLLLESSEDWNLMRTSAAPSPQMPAGVIISTPAFSDMTFLTENLPWFRFMSSLESQGIVRTAVEQGRFYNLI